MPAAPLASRPARTPAGVTIEQESRVSEVYEFHVAGLVGPVVRAAMPELSSGPQTQHSVLTGVAGSQAEIDHLLTWLADHHLVANHIMIAKPTRWHLPASADQG